MLMMMKYFGEFSACENHESFLPVKIMYHSFVIRIYIAPLQEVYLMTVSPIFSFVNYEKWDLCRGTICTVSVVPCNSTLLRGLVHCNSRLLPEFASYQTCYSKGIGYVYMCIRMDEGTEERMDYGQIHWPMNEWINVDIILTCIKHERGQY